MLLFSKKTIGRLVVGWLFFSGCTQAPESKPFSKTLPGGICAGGVFTVNENDDIKTLYPPALTANTDVRVGAQLFDGLLRLNPSTLGIEPALCQSWEYTDDSTSIVLNLRSDVWFHENACFGEEKTRQFTAADAAWCLQRLCTERDANYFGPVLAARIRKNEAAEPDIEVVDDFTVRVGLVNAQSSFLKLLAHPSCWIYPQEAVQFYGSQIALNPVGTGPFVLLRHAEDKALILGRNNRYWMRDLHGNALPYLDGLRFVLVKSTTQLAALFQQGVLHAALDVPPNFLSADSVSGDSTQPNAQVIPAMRVDYLAFQHERPLFADVRIRKAFAMAIDRDELVTKALMGVAEPASHGLVPPVLVPYDALSVSGLRYDPEMARLLLREAGYPNGEGFPVLTLQIHQQESGMLEAAEVIQEMLATNLGVQLDISSLPKQLHYEKVEAGNADIWRDSWVADYPDPENFLNLFYGELVPEDSSQPSVLNSMRYKNIRFDTLFERARLQSNESRRMELFQQAEQIAISDVAVIPLWYGYISRAVQPQVRNLKINSMNMIDFSAVYLHCEGGPAEEN